MHKFLTAFTLACAATLPIAAPAQAQAASATASAKVDPAYFNLYDAIVGSLDVDVLAAKGADEIFDGLVRNEPAFADMAKKRPAMRDEFRTAATPYLAIWMDRSKQARRNQGAVAFAKYMDPAEAGEIAQFWGSPLGKRFVAAISRNISMDGAVDAALKTPGKGDFELTGKDQDQTVSAAVAEFLPTLNPAERSQMEQFAKTRGFAKLQYIGVALKELPQPGMEEFSTPEEREGFKKAIFAVFARARGGN